MKTILLLATIMFFSHSCTTQDAEMEQNTAFKPTSKMLVDEFPGEITSVYFQHWVAGVRGGGSGINFYIELGQPLPDGVILSQVYFRDQKEYVNMVNKTFCECGFRNDVNEEYESNVVSKSKNETTDIWINSVPVDDTQAVLVYYENHELKSYLISNIKEIPPLEYP